jgi:hypothetical protein
MGAGQRKKQQIAKGGRGSTAELGRTVSFNVETQPSPDRQYVADAACFYREESGNRYRFVFWQFHQPSVAASAVAVVMPPDAVRQFLSGMADMVRDQTERLRDGSVRKEELRPLATTPAQYIVVKANAVRAVGTIYDASWDFFDAQVLPKVGTPGVRIQPVLRVEMTSSLCLALGEEVAKYDDELPPLVVPS